MLKLLQNKALLVTRDQLNEFTSVLKESCIQEKTVSVKLRNNTSVDVCFLENDEFQGFHTTDWSYVWHNDGSSVTSKDFDMISFTS